MRKFAPLLLLLFGLLLLFIMGQDIAAGVCILISCIMIIEKIWPEKWDADQKKKVKQF